MKELILKITAPPKGVHLPGSTVTGTVTCVTDKPKNYKQILVKLEGKVNVHFTEHDRETTTTTTTNDKETVQEQDTNNRQFTAQEKLVSFSSVLWDRKTNGGWREHPSGTNKYNFSFDLPVANIPASYKGQYGEIEYIAEARVIKGTVLKKDKVTETTITVGSIIKIDKPELIRPMSKEVRKTLCCLCCASGPIVMTARIPHTGYCIGYDTIPIEVSVENGSSRVIQQVTLILQQEIHYRAEGRVRYEIKKITNEASQPIEEHTTSTVQFNPITVQSDIPTTLQYNALLSIKYSVIVMAEISLSLGSVICFPIVLGNVPLERH